MWKINKLSRLQDSVQSLKMHMDKGYWRFHPLPKGREDLTVMMELVSERWEILFVRYLVLDVDEWGFIRHTMV